MTTLNAPDSLKDLLGIQLADGSFLCHDCIRDEALESTLDNEENTPIFNYDTWFGCEQCSKCDMLVEQRI